jgi:hypothetical protein
MAPGAQYLLAYPEFVREATRGLISRVLENWQAQHKTAGTIGPNSAIGDADFLEYTWSWRYNP